MDLNILVEQTIANWQLYHTAAVVIGAVLCIVVGCLLIAYFAPWVFIDILARRRRE